MGNSTSQRVNSRSTGLDFSISNSVTGYLTSIFKRKSIFVPKNSSPIGLALIFKEIHDPNSDSIVFPPPLIALHLLYSVPGELWNWNYPKPPRFPTIHGITARDGLLLPTSPDDIIRSEEYTCVVSTKDGYPKMTHLYGDTVIDCHPIPRSMVAAALGCGNHRPLSRGESSNEDMSNEFIKHCYICRKNNKQMSDACMNKDEIISSKERCDKELNKVYEEARNEIKKHKN